MIAKKTEAPTHFNWQQQLRFELIDDPNDIMPGQQGSVAKCVAKQTNTTGPYGYEYQGNNGRLVVTPMTDRGAGEFAACRERPRTPVLGLLSLGLDRGSVISPNPGVSCSAKPARSRRNVVSAES